MLSAWSKNGEEDNDRSIREKEEHRDNSTSSTPSSRIYIRMQKKEFLVDPQEQVHRGIDEIEKRKKV